MVARPPDRSDDGLPVLSPRARERVLQALGRQFESGPADGVWPGAYEGGVKVDLPPSALMPGLAWWLLTAVVGGVDTGRDEKLAWQIRFLFNGRRCALAFQKFGLRLYLDFTDQETEAELLRVAETLVGRVEKAIRVAERHTLRSFAEEQVRAGHVTVTNQYRLHRGMYEHFRLLCEAPPDLTEGGEPGSVWNQMIKQKEERFFHGVAMINAYFSLLEHTFVLVWPFINYDPAAHDLEGFILKGSWAEKYKVIFDVSTPGEAKDLLDGLRSVAEEYRNTYAHGGFGKDRAAFAIHFPHGAIPAQLSGVKHHPQFEFFPIDEPSLDAITDLFDRFDRWLETGPARFGIRYAEAGFDVPFNTRQIETARDAMTSDASFGTFLDSLGDHIDRLSNMDF